MNASVFVKSDFQILEDGSKSPPDATGRAELILDGASPSSGTVRSGMLKAIGGPWSYASVTGKARTRGSSSTEHN